MAEFPYQEIRRPDGDYFSSWKEAQDAGYEDSQIWSVATGDENLYTYGPAHHYVNIIGFIATNEHHDGDTYYEDE